MVTLNDPAQLLSRFEARFRLIKGQQPRILREAGLDALHETTQLVLGDASQPQGIGRPGWLEEMGHPYGWGKRPFLIPVRSVGIITGDLLKSLFMEVRFTSVLGESVVVGSNGSCAHAAFILSIDGTDRMKPRMVKQDMYTYSLKRCKGIVADFVKFQRSLL